MNKTLLIVITLLFSASLCRLSAQEVQTATQPIFYLQAEVSAPEKVADYMPDLDNPRTKSIVYSLFVPGSGQIYLGQELKGVLITLGFFGSAVTLATAQNNMIARDDRIKALTGDYLNSSTYAQAEKTYREILIEKDNRQNDYRRRNLFALLTSAIWVYNMVDIIMTDEDFKDIDFSYTPATERTTEAFRLGYKIAVW